MEVVQYIRLFRKWAWLILVGTFVAGGVAFIISIGRPAVYEAQTTIAIGRFIEQPNPNRTEIQTGIDLAVTYAQLVRTYDVLQATIDALDLPLTTDELDKHIQTKIITGTSLLNVSVTYTDPTLTADIANMLASQLILQSPTNLTEEQQAQIEFASQQVDDLNAQLRDARDRVALLDEQLNTPESPEQIAALTTQRDALINQINATSATIAEFSGNITALQQRTNALDIVEQARIPINPTGSSPLTVALTGALVGAALVGGVVLFLEYMDDKIRTSEQAAQMLKLPVLGTVMRFGSRDSKPYQMLVSNQPLTAPMAENYRALRTNLLYTLSDSDNPKGVYLITSAGPEEGKSITAANLAVSMAQAGMQVLLIDADLRRPRVHEMFVLPNEHGLTNLLFADPEGRDITAPRDVDENKVMRLLRSCVQNTAIPRLRVITSGFIPANPTEILGSTLMQRWIKVFLNAYNVDIIIFDTPPALVVADSSVLATAANASVVFVIDSGRTRRAAALRVKEQFEQLGVHLRGVVVNRVNPREETYDYGYGYGYGYYTPRPEVTNGNGNGNGNGKHKARVKD